MLFKNLFTITDLTNAWNPISGCTTRTMKRVAKTTKTTKCNVDDENEKENDKDTEWQHALECYSQSILHGTCLRWSYCTVEQSCALTGTSKTAMQAHESLTHVEVQSMGLKLYRKRMAKRHPAEARIALSILGFQGESRRQEFFGNKSSLSVYTNVFSIRPRTDRKNASTIRWHNRTLRFDSRTNTSTNETSRNQIRKIGQKGNGFFKTIWLLQNLMPSKVANLWLQSFAPQKSRS